MKIEKLILEKEELLKQIKQLEIDSSKELRDEGMISWSMKADKRKMQARLSVIEDKLAGPEQVTKKPLLTEKPVTKKTLLTEKKTTIKKEVEDEEIGTEEDN